MKIRTERSLYHEIQQSHIMHAKYKHTSDFILSELTIKQDSFGFIVCEVVLKIQLYMVYKGKCQIFKNKTNRTLLFC